MNKRKIISKCKIIFWALLILVMIYCLCACGDDYYFDDEYDYYDDDHDYHIHHQHFDNENSNIESDINKNSDDFLGDYDITPLFEKGAIRDKQVKLKGDGSDIVTILLYMNGSNLESEDNEATTDLSEMVAAGSSNNVNLLVQTMGTKKWSSKYGIAADRSQIYSVNGNGLNLVKDDLGQKDCTASSTLSEFIMWGVQNYPADRYILLFWNHGGGPVYGYGYDEWNADENAALTIDEMQAALKKSGVYFDFVGMDCCLMSCLEVCCAFYDYCDYMVLSEDFESGLGWNYTRWLRTLYNNTSVPTTDLGKIICDDMVQANEDDSEWGDKSIMAVIDQSMLKVLFKTWTDFAYANENSLMNKNYSRVIKRRSGGRVLPTITSKGKPFNWNYDFSSDDSADMAEYYVTDIMEVASNIDSEESKALSSAISNTLLYVKNTSTDSDLTGIAVSLPYGDKKYYNSLKNIFTNIGLDSTYVKWLENFVNASGSSSYYDYEDWDNDWCGWDDYEDEYDWSDWGEYDDSDDYWNDDCGWNCWNYEDSWNNWFDDSDWDCDNDDCWNYEGDDWFYDEYDYY